MPILQIFWMLFFVMTRKESQGMFPFPLYSMVKEAETTGNDDGGQIVNLLIALTQQIEKNFLTAYERGTVDRSSWADSHISTFEDNYKLRWNLLCATAWDVELTEPHDEYSHYCNAKRFLRTEMEFPYQLIFYYINEAQPIPVDVLKCECMHILRADDNKTEIISGPTFFLTWIKDTEFFKMLQCFDGSSQLMLTDLLKDRPMLAQSRTGL